MSAGNKGGKGRDTRRWRVIKAAFKAKAQSEDHSCWICTRPIDYTIADFYDDNVFEPDHLYPRSTHPERAEDPANLRASHRGCNRNRGNSMHIIGLGKTSKSWLVD